MTGVPEDDRDRVRSDYTSDDARTQQAIESELRDADFDSKSAQVFAKEIAGSEAMPGNEQALVDAQRQAVDSLGDGGAINGEVIRGSDPETGRTQNVGATEKVELNVSRSGRETGDVVARNKNTGTEAIVGQVDIAAPPEGSNE